ncbi:FUSC family membrane protein [Variovorax dokdonensis]|uniref:FUSC family membrane protein n=1 Tax=Variovorax dokdonensis TaxID=344883 RepID=A0ABT7NEW6_9BURK|nr:FUSC family membrane protein [Variovorax dokdonensis]MDM0046462.1 FUSC family membrane protein [Variovorax dokdonensis]
MTLSPVAAARARAAMRVALSYYVTNGVAVALGLAFISAMAHLLLGPIAAAAVSVGVIVATPPDLAAPRRGKLRQMLPAPLIGVPLFFAVQMLHTHPLELGLLLVPATFFAFLGMAWGKRGIPIAIAVMFSMIFAMATPPPASAKEALSTTMYFGLGGLLYVVWAALSNIVLNGRYRVQFIADVLLSLAALMRTHARQFDAPDDTDDVRETEAPLVGRLLREQSALTDQLQAARDIVLESPRTERRQRLAAMLMIALEMRDHLVASELDLEALRAHPSGARILGEMRAILEELAGETAALADALLLGRQPQAPLDRRPYLTSIQMPQDSRPNSAGMGPTPALLARGIANRIGHLNDDVLRMTQVARKDIEPDLAAVRTGWKMFVSPTRWSLAPFLSIWRWDAPPLRHAIRATLAIAAGYTIASLQSWGSHDYWILLTITVVLRGSLSQTLERRNHRVAGTLLGCILATALLASHPSAFELLLCLTAAQAFAHAFAIRRYLFTSVAATVLGLVQAHMLNTGMSPSLALFERVADTLIGASLAWMFCYVLPSWERHQLPALVARTLRAQARHAKLALSPEQLHAADDSPELAWRLARREAYDSLSALVQATQRSLSEPRAVQPPLGPLEHLQAHSYQLLAQLSAVKSMLVLRRDRLTPDQIEGPMTRVAHYIDEQLSADPADASRSPPPEGMPASPSSGGPVTLPDPFEHDISPWLLRRLDIASRIAVQLKVDSARILQALNDEPDPQR